MHLYGGIFMSQLSEKELSTIKDLLSEEELLIKKFKMLADQAQTDELKCKMNITVIFVLQICMRIQLIFLKNLLKKKRLNNLQCF